MNDTERMLQVDQMIDDRTSAAPRTADEALIAELATLTVIDWPPDEAGDRITAGVAAGLGLAEPDTGTGSRRARRRRWAAAGLGSAAAAAAVVMIISSVPPPASHQPGATPSARGFLLASAVTASSAPAAAGTYWYVRERDFIPSVAIVKNQKMLFGATVAETTESWIGAARSRVTMNEDVAFMFASAGARAKWEAAGRPPLSTMGTPFGSTQPVTSDYNSARPETSNFNPYYAGLGPLSGPDLTWAEFRRLPATEAQLGQTLRQMWSKLPGGGSRPAFGQYVVQWAGVLLTGPTTAGTRAAVFRLLAGQPGVSITRSVTDPLGRTGVAVAVGQGSYLLIDPRTAQGLAYTSGPVRAGRTIAATSGTQVYEASGWVSQIGAQP